MTSELRDFLQNDRFVSIRATGGIHFIAPPQDERRPRIVLQLIDNAPEYAFDGDAGYTTGRIQMTVLASTYREAHDIAREVQRSINDHDWGENRLEVESISDAPTAVLPGRSLPVYGVQMDITFLQTREVQHVAQSD